jgi:mRNA interferase MazF
MTSPRRGEVWLASFDPVVGHEQAGRRPALILSADAFNAGPAGLVTVLPMTTVQRTYIPSRIEVLPPEGGVSMPSYVIGEQTRTISSKRLVHRLGAVSTTTMAKVSDVVRLLLGL